MRSEEILNPSKSTRTTDINDKGDLNQERGSDNGEEEEQSQKMKLPEPMIYSQAGNLEDTQVEHDHNSFKKDQSRINIEAKEITNYYLELHKNTINTYNSIYSQIMQNHSGLPRNVFFNDSKRSTDYPPAIKNIYTGLISNRKESLKLIDHIITENLDTFIKSIELTQKFYKDIIESYLNYIKKSSKFHC